jgi:hypothetical protein
MYKPQSLRDHITRQVPALARDPDKLSLFIKDGRLASSGTQSLSFEYAYTLEITVLDYAGHPDTVFVPVLQWLKVHQRELFDNPTPTPAPSSSRPNTSTTAPSTC